MCNNEEYNLTGFNKVNNDYNIYYKGGEHATIEYLNANGLNIVCESAIDKISIDGENMILRKDEDKVVERWRD